MYRSARHTGTCPRFEFAEKMSDGEEEDLRPPRTPEKWEALADEEDRVEENTEDEDPNLELRLEGAENKKQIARWTKMENSDEDDQFLNLKVATDQAKSLTFSTMKCTIEPLKTNSYT
jgi:hypothetical protein